MRKFRADWRIRRDPHVLAASVVLNLLTFALPLMMLQIYDRIIPRKGFESLTVLAIGVVVRSTVGAAESVLTMSGEQTTCAAVYGASFFINVTLNFALIPAYGLQGAAWSTTFALFFEALALYAAARRRLGIHIFIIPLGHAGTAGNGKAGAA